MKCKNVRQRSLHLDWQTESVPKGPRSSESAGRCDWKWSQFAAPSSMQDIAQTSAPQLASTTLEVSEIAAYRALRSSSGTIQPACVTSLQILQHRRATARGMDCAQFEEVLEFCAREIAGG